MTIHTIGEICNINALSIRKGEHPKQILYLDTANLVEGRICKLQEINFADAPSRAQRKINNDTILYSSVRPNLKHFGIMKSMPSNVIVSTGFITLDVKDKSLFSPEYIYYLLTQQGVVDYLQGIAQNGVSAYPSINPSDIANLKFNFPSLSDQEHIASVLTNIDRKIALNRQINDNLEAMARQLYDYWFVQFDFPNENGKPYKSNGGKMVWNEKLKRNIPNKWNNGILSNIANITMGQSPDGSSYNENGNGTIFYQGSTDFGIRFPSIRKYTTAPSRFAKKGDILMSVRAPVGAMNIANNDCCIGRGLTSLSSKVGSTTHLYYILDDLRMKFENINSAGTTFGALTKDGLYGLPVVVPSVDIIKQFEDICKPIFDKQMCIGEEINALTKQRDELLPLLMNGQATVNYHLSVD